ncbi:efflux RND transporter permease subunit [Candidatus Peregrinibacteria bacterium]|nr:MAG: efflux RND transporter permease subunit [Candidatus Peregrinibacteria bacterium]
MDTSIVVVEGVHESLRAKRMNPTDAALHSVAVYKAPLISSTLTTISAFFPMALMTGIMGQYVKHIPITVSITLLTSLFVALFLVSALAAHVFKNFKADHQREPLLDRFIAPLRVWYEQKIRSILTSKFKRRTWVVCMILASLITISFPFIRVIKIQMFPPFNANYIVVNVEAPLGSTIEETDAITQQAERFAEQVPELDNFVTIIGGSAIGITGEANQGGTGSTSVNQASITINLNPKEERTLSSIEISQQLREQVKTITQGDVTVVELESGPPGGAPIEVRALGDDIASLEPVALRIQDELEAMAGVRDISTDIEHGTGEFYFTPKRDQLEFYQISLVQLAGELRAAVFGNDRIKIIENGEETPIVVRMDYRNEACKNKLENQILTQRDHVTLCNLSAKDIDQVQRILINTPKGQVTIGQLVQVSLNPSVTTIRHRDGKTVINVKAYTEDTLLPADAVLLLQERLKDLVLPTGVSLQYGGETEDTAESFRSLGRAMILGILMIAFILVLQFNSFKQPFIIMMTLPLALIGVFSGLALLQRNFSFPGFIGIVALSGVVVNDAIVLIDRINTHVRRGLSKLDAISLSGKERLQPIILTTVTTATGVLPLAFANEIWADLAWSIVFGICFATLLTLVMVPIFYNWLEKSTWWINFHSHERSLTFAYSCIPPMGNYFRDLESG